MSSTEDHEGSPGGEWVEIYRHPAENRRGEFRFFCPGLNLSVWWETPDPAECRSRQEAITRCRAISAAALEWEFRRGESFGQGLASASNFQHLIRGLAQ